MAETRKWGQSPKETELLEHQSQSYAPRTWLNAKRADLTCAFALDFSSAGEMLTRKAASGKIIAIDLREDMQAAGEKIMALAKKRGAKSLNIAGNSAATLAKKGMSEEQADLLIARALAPVLLSGNIEKVVSGGQTGADMSGFACALALGVPCSICWPKGFLQRGASGKDEAQFPEALLENARARAKRIRENLGMGTDAPRAAKL